MNHKFEIFFKMKRIRIENVKNTLASPAQALANMVLPVPGGPVKSAPLGIRAPIFLYFSGFLRKSTNSEISYLASSSPATSLNVTFILF